MSRVHYLIDPPPLHRPQHPTNPPRSAPMGRRWSSGRGEAPAFLSASESTLYDVDSAVAKRSMSKKRHSAPPKIPACANRPTTASTYGSWNSERDTGKFFDLASSPSPRLVKKRYHSDSKVSWGPRGSVRSHGRTDALTHTRAHARTQSTQPTPPPQAPSRNRILAIDSRMRFTDYNGEHDAYVAR